MALSSSLKPYTSLSATDDDEANQDVELSSPSKGYRDDPINDEEEPYADDIAVQSLELEAAAANHRRRICPCYVLALLGVGIAVLSALAGGKYYYDTGGEVPEFMSNFFGAGRGGADEADVRIGDSGGVRGSPNADYSIAQELFEGANDNGDGMVISANQMEDGETEMSQGVLDDEIDEIESLVDEIAQSNEEADGEKDFRDDEIFEEEGQAKPQEDMIVENESVKDTAKDQVGTTVPKEHNQNKATEQETSEESTTIDTEIQEQTTATATYSIIEQVAHDATSFTQGLSYGEDGMIYETTGLYGNSKLHKINPESFEVEASVDIEQQYFGEGSTFFTDSDGNARVIAITWKEQTGFIYDPNTLERLSTFKYTTTAPYNEGWGITYDESNRQFIVSDGSSYLYFWDQDSFQEKRKVEVTRMNGKVQNMLNELEFMDGLVCCNIWHSDDIICVDPATGKSAREYDMSSLWPKSERGGSENVLNGIALGKDHVLITGKRWDRMYKVTFSDWPSLFVSTNEENDEGNGYTQGETAEDQNVATEQKTSEESVNIGTEVEEQSFTIIDQIAHDATSFTQGLSYGEDGMIYETTGLYGNSKLHKINPESFEVEASVDIERKYFGEGSTFFTDSDGNARIIAITWKEQTGFIYDPNTLERLSTFMYTTTAPYHEGWGITYDESNRQFIVSDGSSYLYFWDRDSFQEKRKVEVTRMNGNAQNMLNELEFMDGLVCCNIWHSDDIICVDPATGKSAREYDMSSLWPKSERGGSENVLNGIALGKDHVLITGKRWDRMYKVTFSDWPSLFGSTEDRLGSEHSIADFTSVQGSDPGQSNLEPFEEEILPNYFVPLTPDERKKLKDKLRATLFKTDYSLHLTASPSSDKSKVLPQRTFVIDPQFPKQFMHMHHMKTGGTSVDGLIHCALQRQLHFHDNRAIKYSSMSECGSAVRMCMDKLATGLNATVINNVFFQKDEEGRPISDAPFDPAVGELETTVEDLNVCQTSDCGVMSYCASLHTVRTFGWKDVDKITVIRNPIDRAWSMYRFTLQSCYHCKELKDVLMEVANGTFIGRGKNVNDGQSSKFVYDPSDSCAVQMIGHQATNLLSSIDLYNVANDVRFPREKEIVEEAVNNLRKSFTWIGITDRLAESVDGFRTVFPFLAENLTEAMFSMSQQFEAKGQQDVDFSFPDGYIDTKGCPLEHKNEGRVPSCGTKEMDNETVQLILKLNNRDVAVYQAAVERFELQMEVLMEYKASRI